MQAYQLSNLTSKYQFWTGKECVIASQLRCTSKSVDLLELGVSSGVAIADSGFTHYAGKRRIFNAVTAIAVCAIEG